MRHSGASYQELLEEYKRAHRLTGAVAEEMG